MIEQKENKMNIYLDNAATTPLSQAAKEYLISLLDIYGNPSSSHSIGLKSRQIISDVRKSVAEYINSDINNIFFTSGGAASNTLALRGYYSRHNCRILYSPIAHKSILKCVEDYKYSYPLKVDNNGFINIQNLIEQLDTSVFKPFVIIDYANSEIGTIQNAKEIIDFVHFYNGITYLDCTGSISSIPLDVKQLDVDMCGFSAHKIGGLKGCGILYKKSNIQLAPLIYGSQEQGFVGGTENLLGIASLGKAIENHNYSSVSSQNRDYVYEYIIENIPDSYLVGSKAQRLAHNLYMCFKGIEGEAFMILLDMYGIQVSTGSACNSRNLTPSAALSAIGMNENDIHSCIRMTFSGTETKEELNYICDTLKKCADKLRKKEF